jgi:hypothetical protein
MQHSNALMATSSFDRLSGSRDICGNVITQWQPYSNFRVQTLGGNIIQGQINKIRVAEILFPYNLPTIMNTESGGIGLGQSQNENSDNSFVEVVLYNVTAQGPGVAPIITVVIVNTTIESGYYTGSELAAAIQDIFTAEEIAEGITAGTFTATFDTVTGSIVLRNNSTWSDVSGTENWFSEFTYDPTQGAQVSLNQPNLLWTMGLRDIYARYPPVYVPTFGQAPVTPEDTISPVLAPKSYPNIAPFPVFPTGYAPNIIVCSPYTGCYTQYIDVCSPSLCQAQYVRDGNTNQKVIRRDLIARVYIASDNSVPLNNPAGSRPFVIHRQFKNAKVMKWTAERSIDSIELALYDQFGNQLPAIPPTLSSTENPGNVLPEDILQGQPSDFAITFLVDEHDETMEHNYGYTS